MRGVCLCACLACCWLRPGAAWAQAFPLNTNVALQPAEGQWLYRTQVRWRRADVDATAPNTTVDTLGQTHTLVYGWSHRWSSVVTVPTVYRDVDGPGRDSTVYGVGDVRLLARYQVWKRQAHLASQEWTMLGGLEVPTKDKPFSSGSWDPILGTVYTWRKGKYGFDGDLVYQANTDNDRSVERGDVFRYDAAVQRRLWPDAFTSETRWTLTGLLEVNGEVQQEAKLGGRRIGPTDGHQVFVGPGIVLGGLRSWIELGVQVPVYQDVAPMAQEDNVRVIIGFAWTF